MSSEVIEGNFFENFTKVAQLTFWSSFCSDDVYSFGITLILYVKPVWNDVADLLENSGFRVVQVPKKSA